MIGWLYISDLQPHDEGIYTALVSNGIEAITADSKLTVRVGDCDFESPSLCGWEQVRYFTYMMSSLAVISRGVSPFRVITGSRFWSGYIYFNRTTHYIFLHQDMRQDTFNWTRLKGGTPSSQTGPIGEDTSKSKGIRMRKLYNYACLCTVMYEFCHHITPNLEVIIRQDLGTTCLLRAAIQGSREM